MTCKILALSLLFPNREYPAYGIFVLNRLKAVQSHCDVKVIAPVPRFPFMERFERFRNFSKIPKKEAVCGIPVIHPRFLVIPRYLKCLDSLSYWLASALSIHRMRRNFDLIDVHWVYPDILCAYISAKLYRRKFIVTVRGLEALHPGETGLRKAILNFLLKRAAHVIALSSELKSEVERIGVAPEKISVVLNGVNSARFQHIDKYRARDSLGLPSQALIIVSAGSLLLSKGHSELISAVPHLMNGREVGLYIIGGVGPEGNDKAVLENLIARLGLTTSVHLVGRRPNEELPLWYNAADLFCLASKNEGCPNVVMEALSCGTPVVVTAVGAVKDLVGSDSQGMIVESDREGALEEALRTALHREWNRSAIREHMKSFTWDSCAERVVKIYRSVLEA